MRSVFLVLLTLVLGAAIYLAIPKNERMGSEPEPKIASKGPADSSTEEPVRGTSRPSGKRQVPGEEPGETELQPLSETKLRRQVEACLVVLELKNRDDRPLSDAAGILIRDDGVVLTRLSPLLPAHRGMCRLGGTQQAKLEILGVSYYDATNDLALLRLDSGESRVISTPIIDEAPSRLFSRGEGIFTFTGYHLRQAAIARPYYFSVDGSEGLLLSGEPRVTGDSFLALDRYGFLIGLCRPLIEGRTTSHRGMPKGADYDMMVVSSHALGPYLDQPVMLTLSQLSEQLYTGTFKDLILRAQRAYRRKAWAESIELHLAAIDRAEFEVVDEMAVSKAHDRLREGYLQEIERLRSRRRLAEARLVAREATTRLPGDAVLWMNLGQLNQEMGQYREWVDSFLMVRDLQPNQKNDRLLEQAYLGFASDNMTPERSRVAEAVLIEGLEQLPESGRLHLELGRLYHEWKAYDEAVRHYRNARDYDRTLASQVETFLAKIEDVLRDREVLIVPIAPNSRLIHTKVVIDGTKEFNFIIDTGATETTLPRSYAEDLGYVVERGERVQLSTAGGTIIGHRIQLRSLDLQGYSVSNIKAIVLPRSVNLRMGLVGNNFLKHFKYSVDTKKGEFRLERQ